MHSTAVHKIHCECCKKIEKLIAQKFLNLNQWERQLKQILKYILCTLCLKVKTNHYWEMSLIWDDLSLRISFRYRKKSTEVSNYVRADSTWFWEIELRHRFLLRNRILRECVKSIAASPKCKFSILWLWLKSSVILKLHLT